MDRDSVSDLQPVNEYKTVRNWLSGKCKAAGPKPKDQSDREDQFFGNGKEFGVNIETGSNSAVRFRYYK